MRISIQNRYEIKIKYDKRSIHLQNKWKLNGFSRINTTKNKVHNYCQMKEGENLLKL